MPLAGGTELAGDVRHDLESLRGAGVSDHLPRWNAIREKLSPGNRTLLVLVVVGLAAVVILVAGRLGEAAYTTLYAGLGPEEAFDVVDRLNALGVPYRVAAGGSVILVPRHSAEGARLEMASRGYPQGSCGGCETPGKSSPGITELQQGAEGLAPDGITVADYEGRLPAGSRAGNRRLQVDATPLELRKSVERYLESKAQTMLDHTLGQGSSVVRICADLTFNEKEAGEEVYDRDAMAAYGHVHRLSVAVIVDGIYRFPAGASMEAQRIYQPRSAEEIQKIGALVRYAVGFDSGRADRIEVVNLAFASPSPVGTQSKLDRVPYRQTAVAVAEKALWAVVLLLGLYFLSRFLTPESRGIAAAAAPPPPGPKTPVAPEQGGQPRAALPRPQPVDAFLERARTRPDEVAKVIKAMMLE